MTDPADAEVMAIVEVGHPVLRRRAVEIAPDDVRRGDVQRLITLMKATMEAAPGVGLAAPQVGEGIRLAVMADGPERFSHLTAEELAARERVAMAFTVLVNPVLTPLDADPATAGFFEGCLSVPGLTGFVRRHRAVRVEALDEHAEPRTLTLTGWPARIAQHELDHLDGILYLDRVELRSLTTTQNYADLWSGRPLSETAAELGFALDTLVRQSRSIS